MALLHDALNKHFSRQQFAAASHIEIAPALLDSLARGLPSIPEFDLLLKDSSQKVCLLKQQVDDLLPALSMGAAAALLANLPPIIMQTSMNEGQSKLPRGLTDSIAEQSSVGAERMAVQMAAIPELESFLQHVQQTLQLPELDNLPILRLAAATLQDYVDAVMRIYAGANTYRDRLQGYFFRKGIRCAQTVDDLVSETLFRANRAIRDRRPPIAPPSWIRTLARKVLATHLEEQRKHRFSQITEDIENSTAVTHDLSSAINVQELIKAVKHDVGKRAALACRLKIRGNTDEEVAIKLHCNKKTVGRDLKSARNFAARKWGIVLPLKQEWRRKRGRARRPISKVSA